MARIKQILLDELESRLDNEDAEPYSPPSPTPTPVNEPNV